MPSRLTVWAAFVAGFVAGFLCFAVVGNAMAATTTTTSNAALVDAAPPPSTADASVVAHQLQPAAQAAALEPPRRGRTTPAAQATTRSAGSLVSNATSSGPFKVVAGECVAPVVCFSGTCTRSGADVPTPACEYSLPKLPSNAAWTTAIVEVGPNVMPESAKLPRPEHRYTVAVEPLQYAATTILNEGLADVIVGAAVAPQRSVLDLTVSDTASGLVSSKMVHGAKQRTPVLPLEEVIAAVVPPTVSLQYLVIDAQGFDLEVALSAGTAIRRAKYVLYECQELPARHYARAYPTAPTCLAIARQLRVSHQLQLVGCMKNMANYEYNCVLVQSSRKAASAGAFNISTYAAKTNATATYGPAPPLPPDAPAPPMPDMSLGRFAPVGANATLDAELLLVARWLRSDLSLFGDDATERMELTRLLCPVWSVPRLADRNCRLMTAEDLVWQYGAVICPLWVRKCRDVAKQHCGSRCPETGPQCIASCRRFCVGSWYDVHMSYWLGLALPSSGKAVVGSAGGGRMFVRKKVRG